jgi:hypothetical protein
MPIHTVLFLTFQALRRAVVLLTCCVIAPGFSAYGADRWTDISSPLLERSNGLIVSKDLGVSWQAQGVAVNIWQGPFIGRDEKEMLVIGKDGAFVTRNAGEAWKHVADFKPKERGFVFTPDWFGCYGWDPVNNILYASAMGNPVYMMEL